MSDCRPIPFIPDDQEPVIQGGEAFRQVFRRDVMRLQDMMLSHDDRLDPAVHCPVKHIFAPGAYAREIFLPKGALVVGKIHRHAHLNFISVGKVRVLTEAGEIELTAPYSFVSQPGTKRVVYAVEETVWTTVHVTNETDVEKIEGEIIAKDYDELDVPALEKDST